MLEVSLRRRRRIIKTSIGCFVDDKNYGGVLIQCAIEIVTYGTGTSLVTWFAEGLCQSIVHLGPIDGDKLYAAVKASVQDEYTQDAALETG